MSTVIDYAWSGPSPQQIKAWGHEGVMRYLSHDSGKDLSIPERDGLRALDLTIGLVFETVANRAAQGSAAGQSDAVYANQRANSLGYPLACTLWYAVDFDAQIGQVAPYFQGIASVDGRAFAPYGSYTVCEGIPCNGVPWQTVAWSRGKVSGRAGLLQNVFSGSYDTNKVLKANYGQWTTQPQPPPPEEDDMPVFVVSTDGQAGQYLLDGGLIIAIDDGKSASAYVGAGAKPINVSAEHFQRIAQHAI